MECIIRETKEETGLTIHKPRLRGIITFVIDDYDEITYLYTCDDFSGELQECQEGNLEWVPKNEVTMLPIWEGDKLMFELLNTRQDVFSLKLVYVKDRLISSKVE